ncbi:MAG: T9SS type A sorting domain-containing protein [Bacteroidota bacterium]|nr:T9SS type A sorting domain-containing protein [Bacteroidota bacterium]
MKKAILSIISVVALSASAMAQIPNAGFESFTTVGSYEVPNGWGTMNNTTATFSVYTATKGTPGSPGASYLKLTSKTVSASVVNGVAVSGVLDSITMKPKSGFPCTLQPVSFTGKWQHMIYGTSQGSVKAVLTKWNVGLNKRDTVAIAAQTLAGMAMSWANFTINFTYLSSVVPDSCIIELRASGSAPTVNDYLWVDNLAFSGSVTGIENHESFVTNMVVFPNPSSETINVNLNLKSSQKVSIELTDINGKLILTKDAGTLTGESKQTLNVNNISKGTYLVRVITESGIEVRKIVIE